MKENEFSNDELKQSYLNVLKYWDEVKKAQRKLIRDDFTNDNWKKEGKKIKDNLTKFEKNFLELKANVENEFNDENKNQERISTIKKGIEKINDTMDPILGSIKDKISKFEMNCESDNKENNDENEEEKNQDQIQVEMDLMHNEELLQKRGKELKEIYKTSSIIKDTTEKMSNDLFKHEEILKNIEDHIDQAKDNVEKANEEINKADKLSKDNLKLCNII